MDLQTFFAQNQKVALGFSGGTDSAYLLYAALHYGATVRAYYIKTAFQPQFELDDALRLAEELHADLKVIALDVLADEAVSANPKDRCYYCKQRLFSRLAREAEADGFPVLIDGTNASDDAGDRPGMRALRELKVLSPLRLCGITKEEVRRRSREAGLFTWNKPSYACLATRIPTGQRIQKEDLERVEKSEDLLRSLGFSDLRVRVFSGAARLQLPESQLSEAVLQRDKILKGLSPYFDTVLLDLRPRKGD